MPHILLVSESIGAGHERAASAVEEALMRLDPGVRVTRLNLLDTFMPRMAKVTRTLYFQALAHSPALWGKWYEWQRDKEWNALSRSIIHGVLSRDVSRWLTRLAPDAVVCTHPLPACLFAGFREQGLQVPLCTVVTDFDLHGYWAHTGVDLYCVPLVQMKEQLSQRLAGDAEVRVTGIPISPLFAETAVRGIPAAGKRVLMMGGGQGIGVLSMLGQIAAADLAARITVLCGHNQVLRRQLKENFRQNPNVRVLGFSRHVHRLMAQSDVLVTKPGGLTVSEALAMKVPLVLHTPVRGQEWRNGQIMSDLQVAYTAQDGAEGAAYVRLLLEQAELRERMRQQMEEVRRPYAALEVAHAVLGLAQRGAARRGLAAL